MCTDIHKALDVITANHDRNQIVVVCDANIPFPTGCPIADIDFFNRYPILCIEISEENKSLECVSRIWDFLFAHDITRHGLVVAIGGGVLTDIAGFAASTYKRGIHYVNIPTSLLAMVDASSGGKTGFNYHGLKNSIGLFAPPIATLIWPEWLRTLPAREMLSGFAEMLKTGLIEGAERAERGKEDNEPLWSKLLQYDLEAMDVEKLTPLIERSVAIKQQIVAFDPQETGLRKALNLGHTFGHALEEMSLGAMPHGYAVLYGLIAELYLSVTRLNCPKEPLQQLTQLMVHYYGKPQCKCSERETLIRLMQHDKKNEHSAEINCTLLRNIGQVAINQSIQKEEAEEALEYLFSL